MNFISHFFFDRRLDDSLYVLGIASPDLLSAFNRKVKLHQHPIERLMAEHPGDSKRLRFAQGVLRHFECDALFHNSDFFHTETARLSAALHEAFPNRPTMRSYFIAHVLLELLLDKLIIEDDRSLLDHFYRHFDLVGVEALARHTEWVAGVPLEGYDKFLRRFCSSRHLYRYVDPGYITYALRMTMKRAGVAETGFLDSSSFQGFLDSYEKTLRPYHMQVLENMGMVMHQTR